MALPGFGVDAAPEPVLSFGMGDGQTQELVGNDLSQLLASESHGLGGSVELHPVAAGDCGGQDLEAIGSRWRAAEILVIGSHGKAVVRRWQACDTGESGFQRPRVGSAIARNMAVDLVLAYRIRDTCAAGIGLTKKRHNDPSSYIDHQQRLATGAILRTLVVQAERAVYGRLVRG